MAIRKEYLRILKKCEGYTKKRAGKYVCDWKRICGDNLIPALQDYQINEPAQFRYKLKKKVEKKYLRILEPKNHPDGWVDQKEVFGKIGCKRDFTALYKEIEKLIALGKDLRKYVRQLRRDYGLSDKEDNGIVEDMWNWIAEDYKKMSPEELKAEREWAERPIKKQGSKVRKEFKGREITPEEYKKKFGYYPDPGYAPGEVGPSFDDLAKQQIQEWKEYRASLKDSNR